jgi:myo-inositol-1(or 4)-monophosphatase
LPENDCELLESLVREAGALARRIIAEGNKSWRKNDGTPVSEADLAVDKFLKERLRAARPDYGWLSEESEDDPARLLAKRVFVADPIDGTSACLRGEPEFTICVAAVEDHQPFAAAVYNPLTEEFFAAVRGKGATLNGKPIAASGRTELAGCRMLVRPKLTARPMWADNPWPAMHEEDRCSAAYRLVLAAAGIFDATISLTSKCDWDIAAADLIVREAGGRIGAHDGAGFRYNLESVLKPSAIAAGPGLFDTIIAHTRKANLPGCAGHK